jgi:2',3'-cyclic-nucleotide 2'-phosphodiesterase (5'-nucleotidase family)
MRCSSRLAIVGLLFWQLLPSGHAAKGRPAARRPETLTLTLLHTNDLHGHLLPFAYTEVGRGPVEQPSVGGAARRATLIRALRRAIRNPVMVIDAGDTFTRGPFTTTYRGIADVEAMNAVGYDLAAVGNNEFKAKDAVERNDAAGAQAALLQVVKRSRFAWVCANATDQKGAFLEGVQPYVVRSFNGVRVGFLGLTAPRSARYPQTKGWTISDPLAAAREWIPRARANCDVLIGVTHIGVDLDRKLAAQTNGLDAIVGGDSHTFLYKAVEIASPSGVKVPIVQDGEFGVNLGRFDLHFIRDASRKWRLARYQYALLPVRARLREAPDVTATLAPFLRPFQPVVGHLPRVGRTPAERSQDATRLVANALRGATRADFALHPMGSGLYNVFRRPTVMRYDVYAALPFKDGVVTTDLTGAEVRALLKTHPEMIAASAPHPLDDSRTYRVALAEFVARLDFKLPEERLQDIGRDLREVVIAYLGQRKPPATGPSTRRSPPLQASDSIGILDFYGLRKVTQQQLRSALDLKEGDRVPRSASDLYAAVTRLKGVPGVVSARLEPVCCDEQGRSILFVGIEEKGAPRFRYHPPPSGDVSLPAEWVGTYHRYEEALAEAVQKGDAGDDFSQGHSLAANPAVRAIQERFLSYAATDEQALRRVLRSSSNAGQRQIAAEILGYAPNKKAVVADLLYAVTDPDEGVRNNATRALAAIATLAQRQPDLGIEIDATPFIAMLNSIVWSDRNKAAAVLVSLTASRSAQVLAQLQEKALPALVEMARWKSSAHAMGSYLLLGRIAGMEENAIWQSWTRGEREGVISRARQKRSSRSSSLDPRRGGPSPAGATTFEHRPAAHRAAGRSSPGMKRQLHAFLLPRFRLMAAGRAAIPGLAVDLHHLRRRL